MNPTIVKHFNGGVIVKFTTHTPASAWNAPRTASRTGPPHARQAEQIPFFVTGPPGPILKFCNHLVPTIVM